MTDRDPLALAERYGPYALLLLVVAFMLWVRLLPIDRVVTSDAVYFSGNDPWYHVRMVQYAVRHFPETTPFDPWSYFPFGTDRHSGFGGLFDQIIALTALIVGMGSPSDHTVEVVTALAPAIFGALTAIPTYVIARRLTDRWGGLVAAGLLALSSGDILFRTIVGAADHQSSEAFFGAIAVAGFAYTVAVAYRESPMAEDVLDRNWQYLRVPALAGIVGGVAVASYLMMWPPGVMILATFGVFALLQMVRDHAGGRPTDHLAFGVAVAMTTTGVLTLLYARSYRITQNDFSLLQPLTALGIAFGVVVLLGLSRYQEREGYDRSYFGPSVLGLLVVALVIARLVYPPSLNLLEGLFIRVYSFGYFTSATAGTVAEIQPASPAQAFALYGLVLVIALVGGLLLLYRYWRDDRPTDLVVILWSLSMVSAYFTMARFGYYFSVVVALLAAFAIWWVSKRWIVNGVNLRNPKESDIGLYQVIGLLVILLLIVPGNVIAISSQQPAWERAENMGGTDISWYDSLDWMQSNTPQIPMGYYDQYEEPTGADYDYPPGAYGVMSWWDYGHWITVMGHRIPFANPFQEGPVPASAYFQATNETHANLLLDAIPSQSDQSTRVSSMSTEELQGVVDDQSDQQAIEDGRYVIIDDQMAGGKFSAIATWTGPGPNAYFQQSRYQVQGQNVTLVGTNQRYDGTMLSKLYFDDAQQLSHYRLVHEDDRYAIVGGYIAGQRADPLRSIRLNGAWETLGQTANQLERLKSSRQVVQIGQGGQYVYNAEVESRVKVFERVEGATLTGTAADVESGTPVVAFLTLQTDAGRNVTYVQRTQTAADGSFSMTVPYATDNAVGTADGGANESVLAQGEYSVIVGPNIFNPDASGTVAVPEQAIYDGREIEVDLETVDDGAGGNETAGRDNESAGSLDVPQPITSTAP